MADSEKNKKIKLIFAVVALVVGGSLIAYSFGLIDLSAPVKPGTAETGTNAPLATQPKLDEAQKAEAEADEAELKQTIKDKPASGS